jgi:hypothetical protein
MTSDKIDVLFQSHKNYKQDQAVPDKDDKWQ